jgi:tRNA(fMet)-specific endonuclease VapC
MVMRYLLDSNVWIEVLKGRNLRLVKRFSEARPDELATCSPVRAELMHGAEKYKNAALRKSDVIRALGKAVPIPFDDRCADLYGEIRHDLEERRCVIGPMDLQIASIAMAHDLVLVTGNVDEFSRVSGLKVEDWSAGSI